MVLVGCLLLADARPPVVGCHGRLGPVGGVPVHHADGQAAADECDHVRDHRPAPVLPPADRPALPGGRRVLDLGGGVRGDVRGAGAAAGAYQGAVEVPTA